MTHDELADAMAGKLRYVTLTTKAGKLPLDEAGNGGGKESQNARSPSRRTHTQAFVETPTPTPVGQHGHEDTLVESDRDVPGTTPQELTAPQGDYGPMAKPDEVSEWLRAQDLHHIGGLFQALMVIADDLSDLSEIEEEDICKVADAISMKLANRKKFKKAIASLSAGGEDPGTDASPSVEPDHLSNDW